MSLAPPSSYNVLRFSETD